MPFPLALLLSMGLHLLALSVAWPPARLPAPPVLTARLSPPDPVPEDAPAEAAAETVTTEPSAAPEPPPPPRALGGQALRRAHGALSRHLHYPPEAVALGLEGEVILLLRLDDAGRIQHVEVAGSSGHALLDQAALAAARRLGALPGNPRQSLLPVTFRLE